MVRILIVDDQKSAREYVKSILEQESNFEIVGLASNGHEGIKLADDLNPDIILMDIEMPRFNGLAASLMISQKNPDATIIILSSHNIDNLLSKILNAGATGYLLKEADPEKIINTINLIYQGNKIVKKQPDSSSTILNINQSSKHQPHITARDSETSEIYSFNRSSQIKNRELQATHLSEVDSLQPDFFGTGKKRGLDFKVFASILKRRYPSALIGLSGVLIGAIIYLLLAPKTYKATTSLILQNSKGSISELGKDLSNISGNIEYSPLSTQAQIIESRSVLKAAIDSLTQEQGELSKSVSPKSVQERMTIKVLPNTNILEVSYTDTSPKFAAQLLDKIVEISIAKNSNSIRSEAKSVRQFLENKVRQQKKELNQVETSENLYRRQEKLVSLENQTSNLVNNLSDLEVQEQNLLTQIEEQNARVNNFKELAKVNGADSAYVTGKINQDKQLDSLKTQLSDLDSELAAARSNFTENNPVVISLVEKRERLSNLYQQQVNRLLGQNSGLSSSEIIENQSSQTEQGIGREVFSELILAKNQLEANKSKLQAVQLEKQKLEQRIASLPAASQSLTELVRQREQADENLQFLQRKLEEARIAEAQLVSNIEVTEKAYTSSLPDSPKVPLVIATAMLIGTVLASCIVLLLEKTDNTLYDAQQVERELQIPFLASLPYLANSTGNLSRIQMFLKSRDLYEPYRSFLKRLAASVPQNIKTIVVSSAGAGEGKSVVASHLGAVSAMLSQRTLIVDAHIYQPKQASLFNLESEPSLSEVIEENWSLERAVQATTIEHLFVLSSGSIASESCEILESPSMKALLREAEVKYDLVIIDAPPLNDSCDALALSKNSDGLVIVTRPFYTDKDVLKQVVADLKTNKAPGLGFVVNNANKPKNELMDDRDDEQIEPSLLLDLSEAESTERIEKE